MNRDVRQNRVDGTWETTCTIEVALEYSTVNAVLELIRAAARSLVAEGIERETITFEIDTHVYHDGEIDVTHTVSGTRPSTTREISREQRTTTLALHTREAALRRELAEIEARKAAKS